MRKPLVGVCLLFMLGILLGRWFSPPPLPLLLAGIACSLATCLACLRHERLAGLLILILLPLAGAAAWNLQQNTVPAEDIRFKNDLLFQTITLTGRVASPPERRHSATPSGPSRSRQSFVLECLSLRHGSVSSPVSGRVLVSVLHIPERPPDYGDMVQLKGLLRPPPAPDNEGQFDYGGWLRQRGIHATLTVRSKAGVDLVEKGSDWTPTRLCLRLRDKVLRSLSVGMEDEPGLCALMGGMLLGYRNDIPDDISEEFQRTGTFHILAVSGQNLTFLAALFIVILRCLGMSRRLCGLVVLPILLVYCATVGWQPGCLRAFWMSSVLIFSWILLRPSQMVNSVAFAALVTLVFNPADLLDVGFQFSFGVVLALVLLTPPLTSWINDHVRHDPFLLDELVSPLQRRAWAAARAVLCLAAASLTAWLGSLPMTLAYFHTFAPVTVLANLFVVPLATGILCIGLISFLLGLIHPAFSVLYNNANFLLLKILLSGIHLFSAIPGGCLHFNPAENIRPRPEFQLRILEGQASQSLLILTPSSVTLVDCGDHAFARFVLIPYLKHLGINRIDRLLLTHDDPRHAGGAAFLLERFPVTAVLRSDRSPAPVPPEFLRLVDCRPGRIIVLDPQTRIHVLESAPAGVKHAAPLSPACHDNNSLVLQLRHRHHTFLLASDLGQSMEKALVNKYGRHLRSDVLVISPHTAEPMGTDEFLQHVAPRWTVVSSAPFPVSDRLPPSLLERLRQSGSHLFLKRHVGEVQFTVQGGILKTSSFRPPADIPSNGP